VKVTGTFRGQAPILPPYVVIGYDSATVNTKTDKNGEAVMNIPWNGLKINLILEKGVLYTKWSRLLSPLSDAKDTITIPVNGGGLLGHWWDVLMGNVWNIVIIGIVVVLVLYVLRVGWQGIKGLLGPIIKVPSKMISSISHSKEEKDSRG